MLGLPDGTRGCLFDLDGVITKTAKVHNAAWKEMFDSYLRDRSRRTGEPFVPFDPVKDYDEYVDGKPRADGTRSFLASRGIELPEGSDDDPPGAETVHGLGTRKNEILLRRIRTDGVEAYDSSVRYVHAVRDAGLRSAVVSSSANCRDILHAVGIEDLFEARIDGLVAKQEHLRGKPAPIPSWPGRAPSGWSRRRPWCSRMRWPGWKPAGLGGFVMWWESIGPGRPMPCGSTARTSSWAISPSCWTIHD